MKNVSNNGKKSLKMSATHDKEKEYLLRGFCKRGHLDILVDNAIIQLGVSLAKKTESTAICNAKNKAQSKAKAKVKEQKAKAKAKAQVLFAFCFLAMRFTSTHTHQHTDTHTLCLCVVCVYCVWCVCVCNCLCLLRRFLSYSSVSFVYPSSRSIVCHRPFFCLWGAANQSGVSLVSRP